MNVADYKHDVIRKATREEIARFVYFACDLQTRDRSGWIVPIPGAEAQEERADRLANALGRTVGHSKP